MKLAIILALAVVLTVPAQAQTTVTRDRLGREVGSTTRDRGTVVIRDRMGREIFTTKKGSNR